MGVGYKSGKIIVINQPYQYRSDFVHFFCVELSYRYRKVEPGATFETCISDKNIYAKGVAGYTNQQGVSDAPIISTPNIEYVTHVPDNQTFSTGIFVSYIIR
ncbi:MAG: hypothetical protein NW207_12905 [Cytophagales bacterium]|nr:hypothetical protein [Cytophagales bacterium]